MNVLAKVTRKNLLKNKVRTAVTIIGVILSVAMITAVTTMVATLRGYIVDSTVADVGDWYFCVKGVSDDLEQELRQDSRVERIGRMQALGYAPLAGGQNEYKPYLYVTAWDDDMFDTLPVYLTAGRMPENGREILIPEHVATNGGVAYSLGDTLTLQLGYREWEGQRLWQWSGYYGDSSDVAMYDTTDTPADASFEPEHLVEVQTCTFTVVGFYERLSMSGDVEYLSSPGYTVITRADGTNQVLLTDLFVRTYKAGDATELQLPLQEEELLSRIEPEETPRRLLFTTRNNNLLAVTTITSDDALNQTILAMGAILLVIILVGSVSLIYNAFAISVSERAKQFGLLSSVGATRKQLRGSVLYEALVIGGIGIPLGLLAGIGGIGVTLHFVGDWFASLFYDNRVTLQLAVPWWSVAAAAGLGLVTILLSAWIPARRASRVTAIDAIRQSQDIRVKAKRLKTPRLVRRLFGFEGEMALKNLKRSRRRYRSTVLSLAVSMILFISASSFSLYMFGGSSQVMDVANYDVSYTYVENYTGDGNWSTSTATVDEDKKQAVFSDLLQTEGITGGALVEQVYLDTLIPQSEASEAYYDLYRRQQEDFEASFTPEELEQWDGNVYLNADGDIIQMVILYGMDGQAFDRYAQQAGVSLPQGDGVSAIALRESYQENMETGRYERTPVFASDSPRTLTLYASGQTSGREGLPVSVAGYTSTLPTGLQYYNTTSTLYLVISDTALAKVRDWAAGAEKQEDALITSRINMFFESGDSAKAAQNLKTRLAAMQLPSEAVRDAHEDEEYNRRLQTVLQVFAYGFITLISLITVANVFNTMSTNIHLRRREFAMLQSVGMSPKGFNRMMRFECIFYGLKALLYGLPVSFALMYLMYRSILIGVDVPFMVPWSSVIVSVCSVFLVVFVTMLYATHKIRKENIIDSLKTEIT